ncbi:MAG: hypothetical protein M9894_14885 [Planctomycetes bacterium]|nr:hypothetical protein [Planctomycetota bacterium]
MSVSPDPIVEHGPDGRLVSLTLGPVTVRPPASKRGGSFIVGPAGAADGYPARPGNRDDAAKVAKKIAATGPEGAPQVTAEQVSAAVLAAEAAVRDATAGNGGQAGGATGGTTGGAANGGEFTITGREGPREGDDGRPERREVFSGSDPLEVFRRAAASGLRLLEWRNPADLLVVDVDVRGAASDAPYPTSRDLERAAFDLAADVAFISENGRGVHFVYARRDGMAATVRACVALFLAGGIDWPGVTGIEMLRTTRAPRPDRPQVMEPQSSLSTLLGWTRGQGGIGSVPESDIHRWLDERGMEIEARYSHEHCPSDSGPTDSARDPVIVNENGIKCFHCEAHGGDLSGRSPGWWSWRRLIRNEDAPERHEVEAARQFVHLTHARAVYGDSPAFAGLPKRIKGAGPGMAGDPFALAWRGLLMLVHARALAKPGEAADKLRARVDLACDPKIDLLREESGLWVRQARDLSGNVAGGKALEFVEVAREELRLLPHTAGDAFKVGTAASQLILPGFRPVRICPGYILRPDACERDGVVPVSTPRIRPCRLLTHAAPEEDEAPTDPEEYRRWLRRWEPLRWGWSPGVALPWRVCWQILSSDFPGLNERYVKVLIDAKIAAEGGNGKPIIILVVGDTGTGKYGTLLLVVEGILGMTLGPVDLALEGEKFDRQLGAALRSGAGAIWLDEIARVEALGSKIRSLLKMGNPFDAPVHHVNERVRTIVRAPMVMSALNVPDAFKQAPEIDRRVQVLHLLQRVSWDGVAAPLVGWRDHVPPEAAESLEDAPAGSAAREELLNVLRANRAHVADSIIYHRREFCRSLGYDWSRIAAAHKLASTGNDDEESRDLQHGAMVAIYLYLRGEHEGRLGKRQPSKGAYPAAHGYHLLNSGHLDVLTPAGFDDTAKARKQVMFNLNAAGVDKWSKVLGVPNVKVEVRTASGGHLVARAIGVQPDGTPHPKGREPRNEHLDPPSAAALEMFDKFIRECGTNPPANTGKGAGR